MRLYAADDYQTHSGDDFIDGSRRRFSEGEGTILECVRQHMATLDKQC